MRGTGARTAGSVLAAVLVLVLAACSNTPPPPTTPTPVAESTTTPPDNTSQIVVGVDDVAGGYNPHAIADSSTVTSALAQLLLPSVFVPGEDGSPVLNETVMRSAEVVRQEPFTVAYAIRPDASWSDGAPIAVEDFDYLAQAMRTEPGVVAPAGYRLISGIQPSEGGKRVEVTFSKPYPGWRTLFGDLLPAHLLKDAPGGWGGALADSFPAYGGPFAIKTLDLARGEIVLERNERYWEKPAAIERIVLRGSDQANMVGALRSGTVQFTIARTDATGLDLFGRLGPSVQLHTLARPRLASVLLRPIGGALADDQVRAGIAALIDRDRLIEEGAAGGPSATLRADALVLPPSDPEYSATIPASGPPAAPAPERARELLTAAGYTKEAGTWSRDGKALSVVLAAPGDQEPYARIAKELQRQLVAAGVGVRTVTPQPRELFANLLAMPATPGADERPGTGGSVGVDIAVVPLPTGGDAASTLASTFGCPVEREGQSGPVAPANPAAFCVRGLQPSIDAVLTGARPLADGLAELEPELWRQSVVLPLFQLADTLAIGQGVLGVTPGPPLVGPFGSAVDWTRGGAR
ncbi:ABC-type transport system, substrate-binding protein [Amycolatopsis arida]|uniref:ABC-type transport system, substrate-binding protein n=1 Tax=Amycolatopsis arida TaxID=587909 RepID=A0A1I5PMD5_9PSEU|nr:ABC transporter family substrate-binding protein [Amycolatopsis arida]TDX98546.1 ABC-type transport system substrate-binding protein [Amycolatopsis arida]SFP35282.1 ABC-type transport system, substrate-binding protein [Amycolatopsis arida]